ncbi:hypothetical protein L208DRAFT_1408685 [Tricholoma matsutake]|nr:hypothetical protein L208DRAFT_1408685 [Tricholoma matsutake 945]
MGSQKTATKQKPNAHRSGARKSAKENIAPPSPKQPYPKPHPAYKKVTFAEDLGEETDRVFNVPDDEDLDGPSEEEEEELEDDEDGDEEDQLIDTENDDNGEPNLFP